MTISELARMAGVSISTVSKVMNNKDSSISQSTRERILQLAKEYHYSPTSSVRTKAVRTLTIGVIFRSSQRMNLALNGMIASAQEKGYTILIRESGEDLGEEYKNISALMSYDVDGILWEPVSEGSLGYADELEAKGISYLLFNLGVEDALNLDYKAMGYYAVQQLISRGHQSIACLLTEGTRTDAFADGYRQCLFDNGLPRNEEMIFSSINENLMWKISNHTISAVISSHFKTATELYDAVHELYYNLPYDISLISLKDAGRSSINYPKISTITIPYYEYGAYMCRELIRSIENPEAELPSGSFSHDIVLDDLYTVGIPYNSHMKKTIVVGSINIDNYLNVEELPYSGKTVKSFISSSYAGGKALNTAVGISKLGHQVSVIGNVGNDSESDIIFSALNAYHINPSAVKRCQGQKTGQAHIFVQPDGESMITIMSGANNTLTVSDVVRNQSLFDNASFCILQTEVPTDCLIEAARISRARGIRTVLKPATSGALPEELIKNIDILIPNQNELADICPGKGSMKEQAKSLLLMGAGTVIVTLGDQGCYMVSADSEKYYPAQDFDAIDASGACDAFISSLVSYLIYGYDMDKAIRISHYAAGFSVTRQGVIPSLIDRNSLESYIRQREPELLEKQRSE